VAFPGKASASYTALARLNTNPLPMVGKHPRLSSVFYFRCTYDYKENLP